MVEGEAPAVLKAQTLMAVRAFPARSLTPVVIVVVIVLPEGNEADGVNVAVFPSPLTAIEPPTAVAPLATVKLVPVMVDEFITSLKPTDIKVLVAIFTAPEAGKTVEIVGAVVSGAAMVVKVQTLFEARAFPARSLTPVVIVVVIVLPEGNEADGVNVAVFPSPLTAIEPPTPVAPLATVKLVPVMVDEFMTSLKPTDIGVLVAIFTAPEAGKTVETVGAAVSEAATVVKIQEKLAEREPPVRSLIPVPKVTFMTEP